jgi:hypothetical protein
VVRQAIGFTLNGKSVSVEADARTTLRPPPLAQRLVSAVAHAQIAATLLTG